MNNSDREPLDQISLERKKYPECWLDSYILTSETLSPAVHTMETEEDKGDWDRGSESIATIPPFGLIEGHKWFDQISSQWESQKNRFALICFGKIQFFTSLPAFEISRSCRTAFAVSAGEYTASLMVMVTEGT